MQKPTLYRIGLKNQCFSTKIFWKWILYGFSMSAVVFYISFVTFNESQTMEGQLGDLWLEGTFAYGAIVIVANMTILYGSYSHSIFSILMILVSVAAYFGIFWLFSFLQISTLADQFPEMISYPTYWANLLFFYMIIFPTDSFFNWITSSKLLRQDELEAQQRKEDEKKFAKGFDLNKLAPIHRRKLFYFIAKPRCIIDHGYAFSGESGQAPEIVDKLLRQTTKLIHAQKMASLGGMK